jgi:WD40 repeat protein
VVSGGDGPVRVWNFATGACERTLDGPSGWSYDEEVVAVAADGSRVLGGRWRVLDRTGSLRSWDLATGRLLFERETDRIEALAVAPDGIQLVSGGAGATVVWDLAGRRVAQLDNRAAGATALAVTPDGTRVVIGGRGSYVQVWDLANGEQVASLDAASGSVETVAVTPDGTAVVSGGSDRAVRVWQLPGGSDAPQPAGHAGGVSSLAVLPRQAGLVSSGTGTIRLWDLASGACQHAIEAPAREMTSMAVTSDGSSAVVGDWQGSVQVCRLPSGDVHARFVASGAATARCACGSSKRARASASSAATTWA